jgi:hypothetical protein
MATPSIFSRSLQLASRVMRGGGETSWEIGASNDEEAARAA